jgi:hypothetical protein
MDVCSGFVLQLTACQDCIHKSFLWERVFRLRPSLKRMYNDRDCREFTKFAIVN